MTIAIFHQKYEKVQKTMQNVPKTIDSHQEQLEKGTSVKITKSFAKKMQLI